MPLSNADFARMVRAFTAKAERNPRSAYPASQEYDWLAGVIGTAIADTYLVLEGTFSLDNLDEW